VSTPASGLTANCPLAATLAGEIRASRRDLTERWLERIVSRVSTDANNVFPSDELLDHVPLLMEGIADYLENPADEPGADTPVVGKAMELGALRHAQGFDVYEILKEYEILGGILFSFLARTADAIDEPCEKGELLVCGHRVFRAIAIIQQTTAAHFLRLADAQVKEREDRLRAFNRAVSHEIKNQVGTILGASDVLHEVSDLSDEQRGRFASIISTNARTMRVTIENLTALSRMDNDARQHRHVRLPEAVAESTRQLRERAQSCGVTVTVTGELPDVEVNAAAVELALNNLISNAIKYSDHGRSVRVVQVGARLEDQALVVEVRDNGLGVPVEKRDRLFQRFFRAHETVTRAEGTGLGLSIVREAVESLGGKAWAAFPDEGSVFAFSLPMRRETGERRAERPTTLGSRTEENAALRAP
jgi:signal transduction histidine kinase